MQTLRTHSTESLVSSREPAGGWWSHSCPVCHGDRWLDPARGAGTEASDEWVCLLCGRHEPAHVRTPRQPGLLDARGAA